MFTHYFLLEILEIFLYNDFSNKEKERRIKELNERIESDIEPFFC